MIFGRVSCAKCAARIKRIRSPLALMAAVFIAYSGVFSNQFLFDDEFLIQKNQFIRSVDALPRLFLASSTEGSGGHDSFYRPLQTLAYWVVFHLAGQSTAAFHLLNLSLHAAAAVCVYEFGLLLGLAEAGALLATLLWALHPVHTEAVTYMSATADPMYALFCLLVVICLWRLRGARRWIFSLGAAIAALLSKESAAVLPLLVMVSEWAREVRAGGSKAGASGRAARTSIPFWILLGLYLIFRKTVLNFDNSFQFYHQANVYTESVWVRFCTFLATLPSYLGVLAWPAGLHMERSFSVYTDISFTPVWTGLILFFAMLGLGLWGFTRERSWAFFIPAWALAAHATQCGVVLPVNSFFLEHWLYLPSVSLFLGLGWWIDRMSAGPVWSRQGARVLAVTAALVLGVATFTHNRTWADPIVFYRNILKYSDGTARVHNNLGMALSDQGRTAEAIQEYQKAISISDTYPNSHHNLALAYLHQGRVEDAIGELQRAVTLDPGFYPSYVFLARIYQQRGDAARAEFYTRKFEQIRGGDR